MRATLLAEIFKSLVRLPITGHNTQGPIFLITKYLFTGIVAGFAAVWIAPVKHRKLVLNIFIVMCLLGSILAIAGLIGIIPLPSDKSAVRYSLELFPNVIAIAIGGFIASVLDSTQPQESADDTQQY